MAYTSRHDRDHASSGDLCHPIDGHLKLTLDHFVDFFLRMEMLVNKRAAHEIVMRESHAWGVKMASIPTRQALYNAEAADVHKRHR